MREILFRGKRCDNLEWVEGYLLKECNYSTCSWNLGIEYKTDKFGKFAYDVAEIVPYTVGQFTGLTDKNGKKIFEGDILTIARRMDGMGEYYVPSLAYPVNVEVKWDFCGWMWETICEDKRYLQFPEAWCHFECEIIGNIHDNPELLRGEKDG